MGLQSGTLDEVLVNSLPDVTKNWSRSRGEHVKTVDDHLKRSQLSRYGQKLLKSSCVHKVVWDVADGKSRPLVRMFITRSSRSQAPRRRRRAKNAPATGVDGGGRAGSTVMTTSSSSSSSVAATTSAMCRVQHLKHEPSSAEVCTGAARCVNIPSHLHLETETCRRPCDEVFSGDYQEIDQINFNGLSLSVTD